MDENGIVYLMHLTYLTGFAALCCKNIIHLRVLSTIASTATIYYSFVAFSDPAWVPILWNGCFVGANLVHIFLVNWRTRQVSLNPRESFLSKTVLSNFPSAEVRSFCELAQEGKLGEGKRLVNEGTDLSVLFCIMSGGADIYSKGFKVGELSAGRFIGEMSLLTQSKTRAEVITNSEVEFLAWAHKDIERWVDCDATRLGYLQTALGTQVVEVLLKQSHEVEYIKEVA